MTLWNLIRDFLVEHIFGGVLSNGDFVNSNFVGFFIDKDLNSTFVNTGDMQFLPIGNTIVDSSSDIVVLNPQFISLGDWLSTTFTIITLVLLVMFLYIFVKWIFKLFSGLLH